MIEINTLDDVKLIKEIAQTFSSDVDTTKFVKSITPSFEELKNQNEILFEQITLISEVQNGCLKALDMVLDRLEKLESQTPKLEAVQKPEEKPTPRSIRKNNKANKPFEPYAKERKEYQQVERDGEKLYHIFIANKDTGYQKHQLPINIFELLIITEYFIRGDRSILFKDVKELCELFGITRSQFSKVYYNLTIGKFDSVLNEVDKMVDDSVFTMKKSHIYRNNHDVNIDKKEFNELVSIYANSDNSFLAIYKMIKENRDIDPFDLMIILKKPGHVSKAIEKGDEV